MKNTLRRVVLSMIACTAISAAWLGATTSPALTQNLFEAVIKVNDQAITRYEVEQRARLLTLFRVPGDPLEIAREQLIEDRLKLDAANSVGLIIDEATLDDAMAEFASRGELDLADMVQMLNDAGVEETSFREFIRSGVTWRELVAARFASSVSITEDDLERARLALSGTTGVRVLLSEIVLPVPPGQQQVVQERAQQLSEITSIKEFATAARRFSASPTGPNGGQMEWTSITQLPEAIRSVVLTLSPGEVTDPLPTQQAIILLQLRDIAETDAPEPRYSEIKYGTYFIPGGQSEAALQEAERVKANVDTCDDLYGIAFGQPPEVLEIYEQEPKEIPQDIALQLAQLDPGEISTRLTRSNGQTLMVLMLCSRTPVIAGEGEGPTADELSSFIRNSRLDSYANGYLEQLRAEARIVER